MSIDTPVGQGSYPVFLRQSICLAGVLAGLSCQATGGGAFADLASSRPSVRKTGPSLARGIGFGNALDAPTEGQWGVFLSSEHFKRAAAAGFDHVRLPIRFDTHAGHRAPYLVDGAFLHRVDWAIGEALSNHLSVIVDWHHYDGLMEDPDLHGARFLGIWWQLSSHFQSLPPTVAFELLSEPHGQLTPVKWNSLVDSAIRVVRAHNPQRLILVDSCSYASPAMLSALQLPDSDANLQASFHMYEPFLFTHQGAPWMGPEYQTLGVIFPGPPPQPLRPTQAASQSDWVRDWFLRYSQEPALSNPSGPQTVDEQFDKVGAYVAKTGRRVHMGEFAAIDAADPRSRTNYLRYVRQQAERLGIGWTYWDDGERNRALDLKAGGWVGAVWDGLFPGLPQAGD